MVIIMINEELLNILRVISPEEKALLERCTTIQRGIYMDADSDVIDAKKLLDSGRLITIRPHTRFAHFPEHSEQLLGFLRRQNGRRLIQDQNIRAAVQYFYDLHGLLL